MKVLIKEKLSKHRYKDNHGYLICTDCIMARTGKQTYTRDECFGDGDCSNIDVDRTEDEVFNGKTLASFENVPITIEHPDQNVDPDNYNSLSVGHMRDIHKGTYQGKLVMMGTAVITDSNAIEMVESGDLVNLSCGYDCDIADDAHPKQTNIRGNHIALCQIPRAGITKIQDSLRKKYSVKDDYKAYTTEEIKEATRKLHKEKPFLSMKECYKKVKENIKNGNYLLDFSNKTIAENNNKEIYIDKEDYVNMANTKTEARIFNDLIETGWYNRKRYTDLMKRLKDAAKYSDFDTNYSISQLLSFDELLQELLNDETARIR